MSLKQKAIKGVVWTAIGSWGGQLISSGIFFILARLLGPEAFGLVALASVLLAFMQIFLDQGFSQAIIQRKDIEPEHLDTAFWTSLGFGVSLAVLCCMVADPIAAVFNQSTLIPVLRWLSLNFVFSGLSGVQSTILSRDFGFKTLTIRSLIATTLGGVVGVGMALQGFGVWSLVGQSITNGLSGVVTLWSVANWHPRFRFSVKHFKELFSYGINVTGINVLNFFNRRSDDLLIGYFLGPVALGYYSVAYRMLMITTQLMVRTIQGISMPVFSRLQEEPERLRQAYYYAVQVTSLVAFPAFMCLSVLAPEIVTVSFGQKWQSAIPVMQVLGLVGFVQVGFFYTNPILMAVGKPAWSLGLNCFQAVFNVVCFLVAVRWGIVAVAAAYVFQVYATSPVYLWAMNKAISIKSGEYLQKHAVPVAGTLIMAVAILGVKAFLNGAVNAYWLLSICLVIGAGFYTMAILLISPTLFKEMLSLAQMVMPSKVKKSA